MLTDQEVYDGVLRYAKAAIETRKEIDRIWNGGLVSAEIINTLYVRRTTELNNCFSTFLTILSSISFWNESGISKWATFKGVKGPLLAPVDGDNIDKLVVLFESFPEEVRSIFGLHESEKDRLWMTDDYNMIKFVVDAAKSGLSRVKASIK